MMNTAQEIGCKIIDKAASHVGEKEATGHNDGSAIKVYQDYIQSDSPFDPYCAKFASYVVGMTLVQSGVSVPHVHTASSSAIVTWGKDHGTILSHDKVRPGDLYIIEGGEGPEASDGKPYHHTTIVEVATPTEVHTIEGNYRNGVNRNIRQWDEGAFVRPYVLKG
jgi:hypothetical protein